MPVTTFRIAYLRSMWSFGAFAARQQVVDYRDRPKTSEQSSRVYRAAMDQSPQKNPTFERERWMDKHKQQLWGYVKYLGDLQCLGPGGAKPRHESPDKTSIPKVTLGFGA